MNKNLLVFKGTGRELIEVRLVNHDDLVAQQKLAADGESHEYVAKPKFNIQKMNSNKTNSNSPGQIANRHNFFQAETQSTRNRQEGRLMRPNPCFFGKVTRPLTVQDFEQDILASIGRSFHLHSWVRRRVEIILEFSLPIAAFVSSPEIRLRFGNV